MKLKVMALVVLSLLVLSNPLTIVAHADTFSIDGNMDILFNIGAGVDADAIANLSDGSANYTLNDASWDSFIAGRDEVGKRMIPGLLPSVIELETSELTVASIVTFPSSVYASGLQRLMLRLPFELNASELQSLRLEVHRIWNPSGFNMTANPSEITLDTSNYAQKVFEYSASSIPGDEDIMWADTFISKGISDNYSYRFVYVELNCPLYTDLPYVFSLYLNVNTDAIAYVNSVDVGADGLQSTVIIDHEDSNKWYSAELDFFTDFMGIYGMADGAAGLILKEDSWVNFTIPSHIINIGDYVTFLMPFAEKFSNTDRGDCEVLVSTDGGFSEYAIDPNGFAKTLYGWPAYWVSEQINWKYRANETQYDSQFFIGTKNTGSTILSLKIGAVLKSGFSFEVYSDSSVGIPSTPTYTLTRLTSVSDSLTLQPENYVFSAYPGNPLDYYIFYLQDTYGAVTSDFGAISTVAGAWRDFWGCSAQNVTNAPIDGIPTMYNRYTAPAPDSNFALLSEKNYPGDADSWNISIHMFRGNNTVWLYDFMHSNIIGGQPTENFTCTYESPTENKTYWFRPWAVIQETNAMWVNAVVPPIIEYEYIYVRGYLNITSEMETTVDVEFTEYMNYRLIIYPRMLIKGAAKAIAGYIWGGVKDTDLAGAFERAFEYVKEQVRALLRFGGWAWEKLKAVGSFIWETGLSIYEWIETNIPEIVSALYLISRVIFVLIAFAAVWVVRTGFVALCQFFNIFSTRGLRAALSYGASINLGMMKPWNILTERGDKGR